MKQKVVGTYRLGDDSVQLVLREGTGGDFWFQPGDIHYCRMKIGADDEWQRVLTAILHEAEEAAAARICCRFTPDDEWGRDNASYVFLLRHEQFSDVCARAGIFLAECLSDVTKAWKAWRQTN